MGAECFVPLYHVIQQHIQHSEFKYKINPRKSNQKRKKKYNGPCIERKNVGKLHQRQAPYPEKPSHLCRGIVAILPAKKTIQFLKAGRHLFLGGRVVPVKP